MVDRLKPEGQWTDATSPKDDDSTKNLRPEDEAQEAKEGTKIGLLPKDDVMADFRKIAEGEKD